AYSEKEFKRICESDEKSSVHFLLKENGRLFWIQSKGSIDNLAKYRKTDSTNMDDYLQTEDEMIKMSGNQSIRLISDTPGMGKTTVLSSVSRKIKAVKPSRWVIRLNLNDHSQTLDEVKSKSLSK